MKSVIDTAKEWKVYNHIYLLALLQYLGGRNELELGIKKKVVQLARIPITATTYNMIYQGIDQNTVGLDLSSP